MIINTDILIPFMPRTMQTQVRPTRYNIKRVSKETNIRSSVEQDKQQYINYWLLRHHDGSYDEHGHVDENPIEAKDQKHIDILA